MSNTEASGLEWGDLRAHVRQENQGTVHPNANAYSSASGVMLQGLPYEHLFDKAVTASDVGKLNRLVIPKQHAEKHFPLDINSIKKGSILNFEDYTGKIWGFRYSHWSSSQSYVLTKGWTRFVKDKKLAAGDIVSFYRESAQPHHLYISWRRRPSARPIRPQSHQFKRGVVYPDKGSSSLSPFNSGSQITVDYNAEWMSDFWPSSSNRDDFAQLNSQSISRPLVNKVCHVDALLSQSPVTPNGALPLSVPLTKQTDQGSFYEIDPDRLPAMELHLNLQNSLNSRNESTSIKRLVPFVNPAVPTSAQESGRPEQKASSSLHLATRKGVRLFGVTLAEPQRLSAQYHGQLNLFPR